tara:strand:- start:253 stop:813 length:561 start_codon:yes stop_codon:yes gene_type:complete
MNYNNTILEDLPNEIWVDAFGFDGVYEVSNLGRIKSVGRFVNIRNGQRWVNTRIRKQCLVSDGRLTCTFNLEGNHYSQNVAALIFLSFNMKVNYNVKKHCVMHIDKVQSNNVLSNLIIEKISESHSINYVKKLLPHLKINNDKKRAEYLKLTHKICSKCKEEKVISLFEYGRNKCIVCRKIDKKKT